MKMGWDQILFLVTESWEEDSSTEPEWACPIPLVGVLIDCVWRFGLTEVEDLRDSEYECHSASSSCAERKAARPPPDPAHREEGSRLLPFIAVVAGGRALLLIVRFLLTHIPPERQRETIVHTMLIQFHLTHLSLERQREVILHPMLIRFHLTHLTLERQQETVLHPMLMRTAINTERSPLDPTSQQHTQQTRLTRVHYLPDSNNNIPKVGHGKHLSSFSTEN